MPPMLFDPKWEEKIEVKLEPWQQILIDAADIIEKHGWIKDRYHTVHGYCAVGAIMKVGGYDVRRNQSIHGNLPPVVKDAMTQLQKNLGVSIPRWNDGIGRTKEQVVAKLKEVANVV
jgi:hypothetical protein